MSRELQTDDRRESPAPERTTEPEVYTLGFFICGTPHTEPTTWDPSAREPTLPYPHLPGLSPGFLFQAPGNILDMPCC